jgi:hypothetical protein
MYLLYKSHMFDVFSFTLNRLAMSRNCKPPPPPNSNTVNDKNSMKYSTTKKERKGRRKKKVAIKTIIAQAAWRYLFLRQGRVPGHGCARGPNFR